MFKVNANYSELEVKRLRVLRDHFESTHDIRLTIHQTKILEFISYGAKTSHIAKILHVTPTTVSETINRMKNKLSFTPKHIDRKILLITFFLDSIETLSTLNNEKTPLPLQTPETITSKILYFR